MRSVTSPESALLTNGYLLARAQFEKLQATSFVFQ
jgi:hypothetical protein